MALSKTKLVRDDAPLGSAVRALIVRYNELVNAIAVQTAKLDADATVTDTNYTATFEGDVSLISSPGGNVEITA